MDNNKKSAASGEIDLIELIRYLWKNRRLILKITGAFIALGLIIALTSPKQYKVEVSMLPEIKNNPMGEATSLLRQFSDLGGGLMGSSQGDDAISPMLYPEVLNSTPFYLELLSTKITYKTNDKTTDITFFEYLNEHAPPPLLTVLKKYTVGLPWTILNWFKTEKETAEDENFIGQTQLTQISKKQHKTIKSLKDKISSSIDQNNGIIRIAVELGDPYVTAQIADFSVKYLSRYIMEYRTEKTKTDLNFIKERYKEKKKEYFKVQEELAYFRDANRNVQSASLRTEEERLNNKYSLTFNVYNSLAQQLEKARIKVQEETPVIKVLEPVQVPVEKSKPRKSLILIVFAFLGGFMGVGFVFGKLIWANISQQLKAEGN